MRLDSNEQSNTIILEIDLYFIPQRFSLKQHFRTGFIVILING